MDINNLKKGFMITNGSTLLRGMQSITSDLDLLVRESIQNSYDAKLKNSSGIVVKFNNGIFDKDKLSSKFDMISSKLQKNEKEEFISIRDYYTTGLLGPTKLSEIKEDQSWGNFLNLVRNFGKSQGKSENAGGSWGYGKTVFYKLGIGLVIYYSRIKKDLSYEERLMACMVEHENYKNGYLYEVQQGENTGIAWWGRKIPFEDDIEPITNHEEIEEILNCFQIEPYKDNETGTAIIIPYLSENEIMSHIKRQGNFPWVQNIEEYLKVSFQKWYPTRCNNYNTEYIDAYFNEKKLEKERMRPLFKIIQNLYNVSLGKENSNLNYEIIKKDLSYQKKPTEYRDSKIGNFIYCYVDKNDLGMNPELGENNPSPLCYITNEESGQINSTILSFCRKPAMILNYDYVGEWSGKQESPRPDKFLIGLVTPNSENYITCNGERVTLEEYLRGSESPEHNDWNDINEYLIQEHDQNIKIYIKTNPVQFMQKKIKEIINEENSNSTESEPTFVGSALNNILAKLFLPSKGFGKKSTKSLPTSTNSTQSNSKKAEIKLGGLKVENNALTKSFEFIFSKLERKAILKFLVDSEASPISIEKWEEDYTFPINIEDVIIEGIHSSSGFKKVNNILNSKYTNSEYEFCDLHSSKNTWFGFSLEAKNNDIVKITGKFRYTVNDKTVGVIATKGKENE